MNENKPMDYFVYPMAPSNVQPITFDFLKLFVQITCILCLVTFVGIVVLIIIVRPDYEASSYMVIFYGIKAIMAMSLFQLSCSNYKEDGCAAACMQMMVFIDVLMTIIFILAAFDEPDEYLVYEVVFKAVDFVIFAFPVFAWTENARCQICPWGRDRKLWKSESRLSVPMPMPMPTPNTQPQYVLVPTQAYSQ